MSLLKSVFDYQFFKTLKIVFLISNFVKSLQYFNTNNKYLIELEHLTLRLN